MFGTAVVATDPPFAVDVVPGTRPVSAVLSMPPGKSVPAVRMSRQVATGRVGSAIHPDHDGAYRAPPPNPASSSASNSWAAVTPLPQ